MGPPDPQMGPGAHCSSPKIETGLPGLNLFLFFASREWQKTQSKNEEEEHFEKKKHFAMCTYPYGRRTFLHNHALTTWIFCRSIGCFMCFSSLQTLMFCRLPKRGTQTMKKGTFGVIFRIGPQKIPKGPIPIQKVGPKGVHSEF